MIVKNKGFFLLLLLFQIGYIACSSYNNFNETTTTITSKERRILEEFKKNVLPFIPETSYIRNYAEDDLYFLKWTRVSKWSLKAAEKLFFEHLEWREKYRIDEVENEDWSDWLKLCPFYADKHDVNGRPICEVWFSQWPIRTLIKNGNGNLLERYWYRNLELQSRRLYAQRLRGYNISGTIELADADGFTVEEQGCPACMSLYAKLTMGLENHYPELFDRIYTVSAPPAIETIINVLKPLMRQSTRKSLKVFSQKSVWMPVLDSQIPKDQRSLRFGGLVIRDQL